MSGLFQRFAVTLAVAACLWAHPSSSPAAEAGRCTVNWNDVRQRIDGFGASSAWRSTWTSAQADMFFSTNNGTAVAANGTSFSYTGIGLSLLRTRIAPGGTTLESSLMALAQARGARVWSVPWSPQASFKDNNNVNGGNFVSSNNQAYANQLAGYVANLKKTYGVNLYAISIQNEPDLATTYESCVWTAQKIHDFVPYLSAALTASNAAATKIILPESEHWQSNTNLYTTALNDPNVAPLVSIIANHNYDGSPPTSVPAPLPSFGKATWETEVAILAPSGSNDSSITNGVYWAGRIHSFLTVAQVNAWHYWWLISGNTTGNQGLADTNWVPAKRMYVHGNFSRFVRPDFNRIGVVTNQGEALVSAYRDSSTSNFAVVAINPNAYPIDQTFALTNFATVRSVAPWITSSDLSLAGQSAVIVTNSTFFYTLPAMSVVTFTGQARTNSPPTLAAINDQTINAGQVLVITNVAADPDLPSQSLTFSLLLAPTNATLDPVSGIFRWRPAVNQAGTTNTITLNVADNGVPSLGATNRFTISIKSLEQPSLGAPASSGGQISLSVDGPPGPDYAVWTSTNLIDWELLFATNSPTTPFTFVDAVIIPTPTRFYRIQLGP